MFSFRVSAAAAATAAVGVGVAIYYAWQANASKLGADRLERLNEAASHLQTLGSELSKEGCEILHKAVVRVQARLRGMLVSVLPAEAKVVETPKGSSPAEPSEELSPKVEDDGFTVASSVQQLDDEGFGEYFRLHSSAFIRQPSSDCSPPEKTDAHDDAHGTSSADADRLSAIGPLKEWLDRGGPSPALVRHAESPPLLYLSSYMAFGGDAANVKLVATRRVEKGHFIMGVARSSCLHVGNPALTAARIRQVELAATALRRVGAWTTPLVDASDPGRLETIVLLTLELLDGRNSTWSPYLKSLPSARDAAPPSLWASLGEGAAAELLLDTSIGALVALDTRDLAALSAPLASLFGVAPRVNDADVRAAFTHAIGLVATRLIAGVGLVPLFDLINGMPSGEHNATIELSNLAASASAPEQAPCVAAISSRTIEAGEEVIAIVIAISSRTIEAGEEVIAIVIAISSRTIEAGEEVIAIVIAISSRTIEAGEEVIAIVIAISSRTIEAGEEVIAIVIAISSRTIEAGEEVIAPLIGL